MEYKIKQEIKIDISPEEVADLFCRMHDDEQALFFNQVGNNMGNWGPGAENTQIHGIVTSETLNNKGFRFLRLLSDYVPDFMPLKISNP